MADPERLTLSVRNGESVRLRDVPELSIAEFSDTLFATMRDGARLSALFGFPAASDHPPCAGLMAVVAHPDSGKLSVFHTRVHGVYPALTPLCPQAHLFEREIAEQCGITPKGHPWLKPVRNQNGAGAQGAERGGFFTVRGEEVHEVAVGPVHAGIIEPGHFRFQCHGENVFHLEIALGYQHRGVERALLGGPGKRTIHYMETLAGDTSVGHATAYCEALEALSGTRVPARAQALRAVALELERMANHAGDLGALAGDVGYLPTASFCGRLRGEFLNMTASICGSRLGRRLVRPGGVAFDIDEQGFAELGRRLDAAMRDMAEATNLLWDTPSVQSRFEGTGTISRETCEALGLVGVVARACGVECDVRHDFPSGLFRFAHIPISTWQSGDVFARAFVRWLEIRRSADFVAEQLASLPDGPVEAPMGAISGERLVVSMVEGWRGEICHVAMTGVDGRFAQYKIVDPSFHNWMGLALALRRGQISDFPLCNKSFNLSYCGHDL